ncbi:MAG: radical SAM protein [Bacteriovoracaceae bacterium]|nr:radical SAM protein [Bacteriovoracaceae bacterium]
MSEQFRKKYIQVFNNGTYAYQNVEEIVSKKLNHTNGWKCMAGIQNLYIDYDGNVFVCNNSSSKLDRFDHQAWADEIERLKQDGLDITSKENQENGTFKKYLRKFNRSGNAFKKEIDANEPESFKDHWGFLGNIKQDFEINNKVVTCPYETCGCGADIPIPKGENLAALNQIVNMDIVEDFEQVPNQSISKVDGMRSSSYPLPTVLWDLGRRCNYDCSYCWPAVHNAKEEHKDIHVLIRTCDKIMKALLPGTPKLFCFSGGEPTLHPDIVKLTKFIWKNGHAVLLTSNGSMKTEKWKELVGNIHRLQLSAHFEFLNQDRFLANLEVYLDDMLRTGGGGRNVDVKLMTPPGGLEKSRAFNEKVQALIAQDRYVSLRDSRKIGTSFVPLRGIDDSENILEYTDAEIEFFGNQ